MERARVTTTLVRFVVWVGFWLTTGWVYANALAAPALRVGYRWLP